MVELQGDHNVFSPLNAGDKLCFNGFELITPENWTSTQLSGQFFFLAGHNRWTLFTEGLAKRIKAHDYPVDTELDEACGQRCLQRGNDIVQL